MVPKSALREEPVLDQEGLVAPDRVLLRPLLELLLRHVVGAGGLLVAPHPEGLELEEGRPLAAPRPVGRASDRPVDGQQVVAVHHDARHAVADAAVREVLAGVLLVGGGREPPVVVLDHEEDRQLPDRREVERLVEVALAGRAVPGEGGGHAPVALQLRGEGEAAGHRQHRAEVADHPHDALLERAEVEGAVAALGEAALAAEELAEQPRQVEVPPGEDAEVAVHREDVVVGLERGDDTGGDRLLADAGEPLREPALPEQDQHLLLDHAGQEHRAIEVPQLLGGEALDPGVGRGRSRLPGGGAGIAHSPHSGQAGAARQMPW